MQKMVNPDSNLTESVVKINRKGTGPATAYSHVTCHRLRIHGVEVHYLSSTENTKAYVKSLYDEYSYRPARQLNERGGVELLPGEHRGLTVFKKPLNLFTVWSLLPEYHQVFTLVNEIQSERARYERGKR